MDVIAAFNGLGEAGRQPGSSDTYRAVFTLNRLFDMIVLLSETGAGQP